MPVVTVYTPSPYNGFLYFLEGQVHKGNKLGIMNNVGKSRLLKVIFTNIHSISDTMFEKCFYFLLNSSFPGKMVFVRKLKLIYPRTSQHYSNCSAPTFLILFKKNLDPPSFKKQGKDYAFYERLQRRL